MVSYPIRSLQTEVPDKYSLVRHQVPPSTATNYELILPFVYWKETYVALLLLTGGLSVWGWVTVFGLVQRVEGEKIVYLESYGQ